MKLLKKIASHIFIDGFGGMTQGLFATLIIGTIIQQIGLLIGGSIGDTVYLIGKVAAALTSAGIGVGVAVKYGESPLVTVSAAVAATVGGYASKILAGTFFVDGNVIFAGPGEPLGAFVAAFAGITIGHLVAGKTKVDIIVTPVITIGSGAAIGLLVGPPISNLMTSLGSIINWATEQRPFVMGIVVSVVMGMVLTLPISSAALGIILNLSGLAAGAATIGCCCNMVGFAVASYRENKFGGLLAQGLGTSMLQVPNIMRHPLIWLPVILSSAILGPVATMLTNMQNNATGSGMGSAGLVGQITTYQTMIAYEDPTTVLIKIVIMHFILPAVITLLFSELMRKAKWIHEGDMALNI
ncbi:MAG: PTS transporter subunit IIC [Fusicatenibacter sp.]|nr:PTS sugar transporter subunit IIC [Fusicatenibacter sp.]